jgi:hypothetical protein
MGWLLAAQRPRSRRTPPGEARAPRAGPQYASHAQLSCSGSPIVRWSGHPRAPADEEDTGAGTVGPRRAAVPWSPRPRCDCAAA